MTSVSAMSWNFNCVGLPLRSLNSFEEFGAVWSDFFDVDFLSLGILFDFFEFFALLFPKGFLGFDWTLDNFFKLVANR